jgi:hypothetical protein
VIVTVRTTDARAASTRDRVASPTSSPSSPCGGVTCVSVSALFDGNLDLVAVSIVAVPGATLSR